MCRWRKCDEMGKKIKIRFGDYQQLPVVRDGMDILFHFTTIDAKYVGSPEEFRKAEQHHLVVGISGTLQAMWGLEKTPLFKTLFELGKRHIVEKIKDGTLTSKTELQLASFNAPSAAPFDTTRIAEPKGFEVTVTMNKPNLADNQEELWLGGDIVDILDNINAIFHDRFGHLLFVPQEFRATLELVRPANTKDEFTVRVISLAQLIDRLNLSALRTLTKETDSQLRSISLLAKFLVSIGASPEPSNEILHSLVRLRQGYPVHTDTARGVKNAHTILGINYPVKEFRDSWVCLRNQFSRALKHIKKSIDPHSKKDPSDI